jgi:cobalt/nickel transport protein
MKTRDKKFIFVGIIAAIAIAAAAPFLASGNPDGLESAAEEFESAEDKESTSHDSPMQDYSIPILGENGPSGVLAIIIGIFITIIFVFALSYGLLRFNKSKNTELVKTKPKK